MSEIESTYVYSTAIVSDLEQFQTTIFCQNLESGGASINSVLDELLECVNRCDNDLAGGDLVDNICVQCFDAPRGGNIGIVGLPLDATRAVNVDWLGHRGRQ